MQSKLGVPMSEILAIDLLETCEVLCGANGLERMVTKVNVMEVPDIVQWLKPGEFLLTTAYSIKDDISKLNDLIPMMCDIGVAGLGIKVKRYIEELPESVMDLANTLNFPIIKIPMDVSFGDIITAVLTKVVNKQTDLLIQIDGFNNRLKDIMLRGGDLMEIADMIRDLVGAPVAITEEMFKDFVISAENHLTDHFKEIVETLLLKKGSRLKKHFGEQPIEVYYDHVNGSEMKRIMIPILSDDMLYGHVIIWNIDEMVAKKTLFMIEAASSLIALNSSKKLSIYENENKHKIDFIEEILSPYEGHQLRAIEKANYFDFDKNKAYGVVLVKIIETSQDIRMTPNNAQILKRLNAKLVSVVERLQRFYKGETIYGTKSDRVIFLLGFDPFEHPDQAKEKMIQLTHEIMNFSKLEGIDQKIHLGIGRVYTDYKSLYKSYQEADRAIQKLVLSNKTEKILHFDDLGIYRFLSNEAIQGELVQFFIETLGPIVQYDHDKGAELLNTLKVYYACNCNLKRVSEEMFTHYNTIIYRMQRIKEIGNIDFNDPNTSLNVHIAMKILDVIQLDQMKEPKS